MNYKIIATDLDGTLLNGVFSVSRENLDGIKRFTQMGGLAVPITGRAMGELIPEIRDCKDIRYFITSNGAFIYDAQTGESEECLIPASLFVKILDIISDYETHLVIHYKGRSIMDSSANTPEKAAYYNVTELFRVHYDRWCEKSDSFTDFCRSGIDVEMLSVFFRYNEEREEFVARVNALGGVVVTSSEKFNLEIIAEGASKGEGLRRLAKKIGVSVDEIIGVGDSRNDMSLLEAAGLGLAMSNAVDSLKEKADRIVCDCSEHVIPYIIENIIEK